MFPTDSLYLLIFGSGLLGGFGHCIGMCGPVVAACSLNLGSRRIVPHLLYNLGRTCTYALLGGLTGLTGSLVRVAGPLGCFQNITLAVAGAGMIVMALSVGRWFPFPGSGGRGGKGSTNLIVRFLHRMIRFISGTRTAGAYFPMGLVLGFLPCGLLYTALIAAAGAGAGARNQAEGFLHGMALLLLFGIGTAPALLLLGKLVSMKGELLRGRLYRTSALIMAVMGVLFLYRAFR
ncbi:MAG: sulfite exporter TauE/SafE family protein [Nitrospirae bacterium]|nr:sulfite exporter TauE/SafE family protein [Nitrospirota bacterium]